jgi:hypothetical protein
MAMERTSFPILNPSGMSNVKAPISNQIQIPNIKSFGFYFFPKDRIPSTNCLKVFSKPIRFLLVEPAKTISSPGLLGILIHTL